MSAIRHKQRAKQVIVEIIRQAGGEFHNKTNLFKAFWWAHLQYMQRHSSYLSGWPIVKMPRGPGIDRFDLLIGELLTEEVIHVKQVEKGPHEGFVFELRERDAYRLGDRELEAIIEGVQWAQKRTSTGVSTDSHGAAWDECEMGKEMNIYTDVLDDDAALAGAEIVRSLWG